MMCCSRRIGFPFFFSSRRRHTRWTGDWSSDVCSSDLCWTIAMWRANLIESYRSACSNMSGSDFTTSSSKIGRASCRERVYISGVGLDLKKNRETSQKLDMPFSRDDLYDLITHIGVELA